MAAAERQSEFKCTKGGHQLSRVWENWPCCNGNALDTALPWRHSERHGVSNHQHIYCLLSRLFRHQSKKTSKLRVNGLWEGGPPVTGGVPSKGPVTGIMFPFFDDVIMSICKSYWRVSVLNPPGNLSPDAPLPPTHAWKRGCHCQLLSARNQWLRVSYWLGSMREYRASVK